MRPKIVDSRRHGKIELRICNNHPQCLKLICRLLKTRKVEKSTVWPISMYTSSDVHVFLLFCECCWVQNHSRTMGLATLKTECSGDSKLCACMGP